MRKCLFTLTYIIMAVLIIACKKPFVPAVTSMPNNYLVVEGVLNAGNDSTFIKLSRTTQLKDTAHIKPEIGATVYAEDVTGKRYTLRDMGNGFYSSPNLGIQNLKQCRLHITSREKEYASDFVTVDQTPPIDSITYKVVNDGLQFYANAHDASGNVKYYRWDFTETYAYVSYYQSIYKYINGRPVDRLNPTDDIYHCYNSSNSTKITLSGTANLSSSVVNKQPITYVPISTGKLARGYSILLRQFALSKDGYEYWQKLKKNTEQLGSIFDAQPSDIKGNVHAIAGSDEPVIGFISASTITVKRVFIDPRNLALFLPNYIPPPTVRECDKSFVSTTPANSFEARLRQTLFKGDTVLVNAEGPPGGPIDKYFYAPAECVDCRVKIRTGTNVKPSYWPANLQ